MEAEGKTKVVFALAGLVTGALAVITSQKVLKALTKPKNLKITYFQFSGRAGPTRAACQLGRIKYENIYVTSETMPQLKPKLPFGQVPVFEHENGDIISQGNAYLRYVGKFTHLYPSDPYKALKVDEVLDGLEDIAVMLRPSMQESDAAKKLQQRKDLVAPKTGKLRLFMEKLQALAQKNGRSMGGSFCAGDLSIADLSLGNTVHLIQEGFLDGITNEFVEDFPYLKGIVEKLNKMECWGMDYK
jgi:glutathione S-transferase